ncbi:hypothetical protein QA600_17485 [Natronococcus sp. A-GB1]|uniref:hypothetical protein n=1 Tax=Natronococcus sp. A-GB1 TaxID=3037648 RepID=UPI00241C491D|nr:hypothetical protein [Natronococcus sp. A-GB1]MDG5761125.1 hypothetical protein [Natronococcus sp. A-GB1]
MERRAFLATAATGGFVATAGCLERLPGVGLDASLETTDPELRPQDPPDVTVDGEEVTVRGTIEYGSSSCGALELAHADYEDSQARLDVIVVAADDSGWTSACTDDLVEEGYRVEATVSEGLRRVAATEHHVFGETSSTTVDGLS